jgi:exopolysaccharide biosynthesis WecB/TagA/CpsF family protein
MDRDHDLGVAVDTPSPATSSPAPTSTSATQSAHLTDAHTWGLRFTDAESIELVASALLDGYRGKPGQLPLVVTPNVDILVTLEDASPRVKETVNRAAVVLADGQPLVSLSHLAGDRLGTKLAGSDLTAEMWPRLAIEGRSMFAIVPSGDVGFRLEQKHPDCAWRRAPMLEASESTLMDTFAWQCVQQMLTANKRPEFVFIGIGFPKDLLLARSILEQWPADQGEPPVVLAVGASLEFLTGLKKRAPKIFRVMGLEFVHRMLTEPRRMVKRYLVKDTRFLMILSRHLRD